MKKTIEDIAREDGRYNVKALKFIYESLGLTIQNIHENQDREGERQHISGSQLSIGLAELAVKRWGRLAKLVLNQWGIKTTRDLGEIVFLMISHSWMRAQETDRIEDFDGVYDFGDVLEKQFGFETK